MKFTAEQALEAQKNLFDRALAIVKVKRVDYSGEDDPFGNFRESEFWDTPAWKGAAIRFMDKLSRFKRLTKNAGQGKVADETIEDTVVDALNYLVIFYLLWLEGQDGPPSTSA